MGRHMAVLTKMYYGALSKKLENLDIERHFSVLIMLDKSASYCSQKCISDFLMIDKASMVRVIDYLSDKALIKRSVNPDDRREHIIALTDKAKKILPKIHQAVEELNKKIVTGLSKEEIKRFYDCLGIIEHNLCSEPKNDVVIDYKTDKR
jgi:MarR family transcriptional regulator for hemolysin